jgi:hypothetical protein
VALLAARVGGAADVRGTVGTAVGSLGPCAVFDGTNALGLPYGDDSSLNLSGGVDLTVRFRFRYDAAPALGTNQIIAGVNDLPGTDSFKLYLTTGSGPRTYIQMEARTAANSQFFVTWYNYTGSGTDTLSANTWYTCVLRRNNAGNVWKADLVEIPEFGAHANNSTTAAGIRSYVPDQYNDPLVVGGRYDTMYGWTQAFAGRVEGLYVWRGYRATDEEVATMGAGFDPTGYYAAKRLVVSEPQARQVLQRDGSNQATLRVSAAVGGGTQTATDYQYSWNGTDWADAAATVDNTKQVGTFTATLTPTAATPAGRQGPLRVRLKNAPGIGVEIPSVGVGDVFAVAGQSNACGAYTNAQPYSPANSLVASYYHPSYQIRDMADPTHRAGDNWIDTSTESASAGSVWPRFAALWADRTGYPVMVVSAARSGAVIGQNDTGNGYAGWAPDAGVYRFQRFSLYLALKRRLLLLPGGAKACLMMEGESDASLAISAANFATRLQAFADQLHTDCGVVTVISKLPTGLSGAGNVNTGIGTADTASAYVQTGPDLSDNPYDASPHWTTDGNATAIAAEWDARLAVLGYD